MTTLTILVQRVTWKQNEQAHAWWQYETAVARRAQPEVIDRLYQIALKADLECEQALSEYEEYYNAP